jgi:hypothetical protein
MVAFGLIGTQAHAIVPPANDNFASATVLPGSSGSVTGTNDGAGTESGEPGHPLGPYASVWYSWTAPASGDVTFSTCGSSFDTEIGAYDGSAVNALTLITDDDDGFDCGNKGEIEFNAQNGTTYHVAVDGFSGDTGSISLTWNQTPPPANDNFANAQNLPGHNGTLTGRNVNATVEFGEPGTPDGPSNSVWYKVTATQNGNFHVEACDVELAAFSGTALNNLQELASADSTNFCTGIDFAMTNTQTYYIAVDDAGLLQV